MTKKTAEEALEIMKAIYNKAQGKDSTADYQVGYLAGYETALAHLQNIIDGKTTIPE